MFASHALQPISELTLKIVYDEAIIPHSVRRPFLGASYVGWQPLELSLPFGGYCEGRRFLKHTV